MQEFFTALCKVYLLPNVKFLYTGDLMKQYKNRIVDSILQGNLDTLKMNSPSFMMILTDAGEYAYKRKDGIYIVHIRCLKN
jgi:hypothetical protein